MVDSIVNKMTRAWRLTAPRAGQTQRVMNIRILSQTGEVVQTFDRRDGTKGSRTLPTAFVAVQMEGDSRIFGMNQVLNDWVYPRIGDPLVGLDVDAAGNRIDGTTLIKQIAAAQAAQSTNAVLASSEGTAVDVDGLMDSLLPDEAAVETAPAVPATEPAAPTA